MEDKVMINLEDMSIEEIESYVDYEECKACWEAEAYDDR